VRLVAARLRVAGILGDAEYVNIDALIRACRAAAEQGDEHERVP